MASKIENLLFGQYGTHAVVKLVQSEDGMAVSVAPWTQLTSAVTAEFLDARITTVWVNSDDPDDLNMPLDIIGFDCYQVTGVRWRFVLHCIGVEWCWESRWPNVTA